VRRATAILVLLAAFSACREDDLSPPDAPVALKPQSCGDGICGEKELCLTDWPTTCSLLTHPPPDCLPCTPMSGAYRCPQHLCALLTPGCTSCACLKIPAVCVCDDTGGAITVTCNLP
jgi:hypothetical protein